MRLLFLSLVQIDSLEERYIYQDLLREFTKRGHSVTVVCAVERRTGLPTRVIKEKGVTILQVKTPNLQKAAVWEKVLGMTMMNALFKRQIKKHLANASFDLILYSTPPVTLWSLVSWLKERYGATTYLLLKDIFPQNAVDLGYIRSGSFVHGYYARMEKRLYHLSDRIGCMSPANAAYLEFHHTELSNRIELNPNSIDVSRIPSPSEDRLMKPELFDIPDDAVVFLFGGNIGKPQGADFLLELIENAEKQEPSAFFLLIGDGTEFGKLQAWFARRNPANAKLLQRLPKSEFDQLTAVCDVGLILLRPEFTIPNFPSRLLTYLEKRMPVLAFTDAVSDVGCIAEENDFGKWCDHGNLKEALNLVRFFVNHPGERKRMGENGFKFLIQEYDAAKGFEKIKNAVEGHQIEMVPQKMIRIAQIS